MAPKALPVKDGDNYPPELSPQLGVYINIMSDSLALKAFKSTGPSCVVLSVLLLLLLLLLLFFFCCCCCCCCWNVYWSEENLPSFSCVGLIAPVCNVTHIGQHELVHDQRLGEKAFTYQHSTVSCVRTLMGLFLFPVVCAVLKVDPS